MTQDEQEALRQRAIQAADDKKAWESADSNFIDLYQEAGETYHLFANAPPHCSASERRRWPLTLLSASRQNLIFRCERCGALDYVGRCGICSEKDISVYYSTRETSRYLVIEGPDRTKS
jgi:hypothetical protein